jgi:hypothetical protein
MLNSSCTGPAGCSRVSVADERVSEHRTDRVSRLTVKDRAVEAAARHEMSDRDGPAPSTRTSDARSARPGRPAGSPTTASSHRGPLTDRPSGRLVNYRAALLRLLVGE